MRGSQFNFKGFKDFTQVEVTSYCATRRWLEENKQLAEDFRTALHESVQLLQADETRFREVIRQMTGLDKALTDVIGLPNFTDFPTKEGIENLVRAMKEEGFLEANTDQIAQRLLWIANETQKP